MTQRNLGPVGSLEDELARIETTYPTREARDMASALHAVGIGCPFDAHWRPEAHNVEWHDLQARALIAELQR